MLGLCESMWKIALSPPKVGKKTRSSMLIHANLALLIPSLFISQPTCCLLHHSELFGRSPPAFLDHVCRIVVISDTWRSYIIDTCVVYPLPPPPRGLWSLYLPHRSNEKRNLEIHTRQYNAGVTRVCFLGAGLKIDHRGLVFCYCFFFCACTHLARQSGKRNQPNITHPQRAIFNYAYASCTGELGQALMVNIAFRTRTLKLKRDTLKLLSIFGIYSNFWAFPPLFEYTVTSSMISGSLLCLEKGNFTFKLDHQRHENSTWHTLLTITCGEDLESLES